jgi:hypothetical protein
MNAQRLLVKKWLLGFSALMVAIFAFSQNAVSNEFDFSDDSSNVYAEIYYSNPDHETYIPLNLGQLILMSEHKFFVGNEHALKEFIKNIKKIKSESRNKKKGLPGYFFKLVLYVNAKVRYHLEVERNRTFTLSTVDPSKPAAPEISSVEDLQKAVENSRVEDISGVLDEDIFKNLISLCENMSNIIDHEYQWKISTERSRLTGPAQKTD